MEAPTVPDDMLDELKILGFDPCSAGRALKLVKGLYGLKQAGKVWNRKVDGVLVNSLGFSKLHADPCVYIKREDKNYIIAVLYVDDMLFAHNWRPGMDRVRNGLSSVFSLTLLGEPQLLLGIRITRKRHEGIIALDQAHYIKELTERFHLVGCKNADAPHIHGVLSNTPTTDDASEKFPYRELIGALNFIACGTRPDIAQAVSTLSRFLVNPGRVHWESAKRVLRYLVTTIDLGLVYRRGTPTPNVVLA
jgi:hypothetical protein